MKYLFQGDEAGISELLLGRRIVAVEEGKFPHPDYTWETVRGKLTLDNGTVVLVVPNEGCGGCSSGWYHLTSLAECDNIITDVRVTCETDGGDWYNEAKSFRIYVVADAVEINAVQIDGDDGNGYYGTGFSLIVIVPGEDAQHD